MTFSFLIPLLLLTGTAFAGETVPPHPAPTEVELGRDRQAIDQLENAYFASYQDLEKSALRPDALVQRIEAFLETADDSEASKTRRTDLLQQLDQWNELQRKHQALIDRLNVDRIDYFVKQIRAYSESTFQSLLADPNFPEIAKAELFRARNAVIDAYEAYLANLGRYGTPKDTLRLGAIREVFAEGKNYFRLLEILGAPPAKRFRLIRKRLAKLPARFMREVKLLALLPDALQLGSDILLRGGGKINRTVNAAFIKAAELRGYRVDVDGMENLALATVNREEKTINIVTKVHRGPILDNMVLAKLGLKDYAFVTSFGGDMPKFFSDRLKDNPGLAFVGPGFPNGIETVTEKAIRNPERIMVNYAEGSIGNAGESRPIAEKFSTVLIPELRKKGWRVNLIPVTSQAASFMKTDFQDDLLFGKIIKARVHPPIRNEVIDFLEKSDRLPLLGILIRATWLSELESDYDRGGKLIEGALTFRGIEEMTLKYLNLENSERVFCPRFLLK